LQYEIIVNDLSGNLSSETASSCTVAPCPVAPTKNTFNSMLFEPVPSGFFSTGQAKLGFFEKNGCSYLGVPVLADVMRTQFSGSSQNVQNQPMASIASGLKVAERIFNWAERAFPDWFILLSATVTQGNEAIRCYSGVLGNLCLAEKAGKILVRWPTGKTQDLGSSSDYLREARNAGF
jgi:hypothetical protein